MPNPFLPLWEYIPDGEPRVFGDRVYIYGSHDRPGSDSFCNKKLKVWSAPVSNPTEWVCHGHIFHTTDDTDHKSDTDWAVGNYLYAPDVVEKDGKYYLYAYIMGAIGCVAVSDRPEGPFKLISKYKYDFPQGSIGEIGWFIDPGVLVDDDGRVYIYCGFENSFMAELNPDNMYEIIDGTYQEHIIPVEEPFSFFEACSPRKIGDTYYMIFMKTGTSCLAYATSKSPTGPFEYKGHIVDNGADYPGGNNHGSICCINGQWYVFYHRMTNGTIMSRRACVEKIEILPDGTIPQVEMTSLGFEESLNPYKPTPAEIACVLKGDCVITERNIFERPIINIKEGHVIGYKYYDFGEDYSTKTMQFSASLRGCGNKGKIHILLDNENGEEIGLLEFGLSDGVYSCRVKAVQGRHAIFFKFESAFEGWFRDSVLNRSLCELNEFTFLK